MGDRISHKSIALFIIIKNRYQLNIGFLQGLIGDLSKVSSAVKHKARHTLFFQIAI